MNFALPDAVRRAIRTFFQAAIGVFLTFYATGLISPDAFPDVNVLKRIGWACLFAGIVAVVTFVQNQLEDKTNLPALLKARASTGNNPVPENEPTV